MMHWKINDGRHAALGRVLSLVLLVSASAAVAQDAWRESAAAQRATLAQKESLKNDDYNIKAGPLQIKLNASLGTEFNDNVTLADVNPSSDFAILPQFNVGIFWPVSQNNTLAFNFGIGYLKYFKHSELDQFLIAPSSAVSFDFHVGDVAVNLHDRIAQTQNSTTDPTVSGTGNFSAIENTAGLRVDWELSKVFLSVGYDHYNYLSTSTSFSNTLDRSSELLNLRAGVIVNEGLRTGIELGGGLTSYDMKTHNDNSYYSAGVFAEAQITQVISARASGGFLHYDFDTTGTVLSAGATDGYYADLSVDHQITQVMNHGISIGRETRAGTSTDLFTLNYLRYRNNWNFMRDTVLKTTVFYQWSGAAVPGGESFNHFGGGLSASYQLTKNLTGTLGYQLVVKDSNLPLRDYLQNRVSLDLLYSF